MSQCYPTQLFTLRNKASCSSDLSGSEEANHRQNHGAFIIIEICECFPSLHTCLCTTPSVLYFIDFSPIVCNKTGNLYSCLDYAKFHSALQSLTGFHIHLLQFKSIDYKANCQ